MVFYLKDAYAKTRFAYAPLHIFVYSVTENDKVNNWSQEMYAITPYIDFEHIKGKDNVLEDSLLRLKTLGSYKAYDPSELGNEYCKSI